MWQPTVQAGGWTPVPQPRNLAGDLATWVPANHADSQRAMRVALMRAATAVAVIAGAGGSGCGQTVLTGRAPVVLVIDRLEGASGAEPAELSNVLHSDVETLVGRSVAAGETSAPTVFADSGRAELRVALKDIGQPESPATPTENNAVTVSRYRVSYRRTDGRSVPGVDVPYGFDAAVTVTVDGTGPAPLGLELVRAQAKREPPLSSLRGGGGALAISAVADVIFYGHDRAGNEVTAAGALLVVFADWDDPQ